MCAGADAPRNDEAALSDFPSKELSPTDVVTSQLNAMEVGDTQKFWRFMSPEGKRATGRKYMHPIHPHLRAPLYAELPQYAPLVNCVRWQLVGAVLIGERTGPLQKAAYQCRARVWPCPFAFGEREMGGGQMAPPPIEFVFRLSLQPHVVPVCYDYDPMQAGISSGPPFPDCWLTDEVKQDERRDDGGDRDASPSGDGGGGIAQKLDELLVRGIEMPAGV